MLKPSNRTELDHREKENLGLVILQMVYIWMNMSKMPQRLHSLWWSLNFCFLAMKGVQVFVCSMYGRTDGRRREWGPPAASFVPREQEEEEGGRRPCLFLRFCPRFLVLVFGCILGTDRLWW